MRASCLCSRAGALLYLHGLHHADILPLCDSLRRQSARGRRVKLERVMMGAYNNYAKCDAAQDRLRSCLQTSCNKVMAAWKDELPHY